MKFILLLTLLSTLVQAQECSKLGVEIFGEVKYVMMDKEKKVKASKYFKLPKVWNTNSNNFHKLMLKSDQPLDKMLLAASECLKCKKEKKTNKSYSVNFKSNNDFSVQGFKLNEILNESLIYPAQLELSFLKEGKKVCTHTIKMERIK